MKKQLQGIAVVLISILLTLAYGGECVGDLDLSWHTIFVIIGLIGLVMVFLPDKKNK